MNFLKRFGLAVAKIGQVVLLGETLAQPFLGAAAPGNKTVAMVQNDLTKIGQAVGTTEVVVAAISDPAAKTGPDKLKAASVLTSQIVQTSELLAGKKIKNEALFTEGCTDVTNGVAKILNAVE